MSEQKPNWVAMRAACQIDAVLKDLLKAVEQDVKAMNDIPTEILFQPTTSLVYRCRL